MVKKTFLSAFLISIIISGLFVVLNLTPAQASTSVSGIITTNTTWTKTNSPFALTGNVLINNSILTIEAGTTVNLNGYFIEVNGTLVAKGTGTNPINFNNGYQAQKGIIFDPTSSNWNENSNTGSIIDNAVFDSVGIFVKGAEPKINSNLFYNSGNYTTAPYAIAVLGPSSNPAMVISNNTFGSGYTLSAIDISQPPTPIIVGNNFVGKSAYNINLWYYTPDVNAANNWWGTTDPQAINKTINDFYDNFQFGKVNFVPFLTKPNPTAPTYTPTTTPTPTSTSVRVSPSPTSNSSDKPLLEISCRSSTSYSNFKVDISGTLTNGGISISNADIQLSYSINNGNSWIDLTTTTTDGNGGFVVSWNAQVSGNYLIKAIYQGNSVYQNTSTTVSFVVTPYQQQNVFSVASNSTITALYFNSTSNQLSFNTEGASGTTGYVNIYLPKSLVSDAVNLKVYLDGSPMTFTANPEDDAWLVSFTYHQSNHQVTIDLGSQLPTDNTGEIAQWIIIVGVVGAILVVSVLLVAFMGIKRNKGRTAIAKLLTRSLQVE